MSDPVAGRFFHGNPGFSGVVSRKKKNGVTGGIDHVDEEFVLIG